MKERDIIQLQSCTFLVSFLSVGSVQFVSIWRGMSILTCQVLKFCSAIRVVVSVFNIVC